MNQVLVIGAGQVGAHIAQCGIIKNLSVHFKLLDPNHDLTRSQTLDLKDTLLFSKNSRVSYVSTEDISTSELDIIIITAGANQKQGETRLDLLDKNTVILESISRQLGKLNPSTVIIMVTNPVDVMTKIAQRVFSLPEAQIIGSGTLLDSSRLRWRIAEELGINITNIHGYVLGEHGDSEFVAWSSVNARLKLTDAEKREWETAVRREAYDIIEGKGATYFGIGASTIHILSAILNDTREVMPLSVNYPHFKDESLRKTPIGVPAVIGKAGIIDVPEIVLSDSEMTLLESSAKTLKQSLTD